MVRGRVRALILEGNKERRRPGDVTGRRRGGGGVSRITWVNSKVANKGRAYNITATIGTESSVLLASARLMEPHYLTMSTQ